MGNIRFQDHLLLWNALVDMYARSEKVLEARRVFGMLGERDKMTYTSMIAGYGMQGEGQAALKLFEEMNNFQMKPDHITMIAVLSACKHSGLLNKTNETVRDMPYKSTHVMWATLNRSLSDSSKYRDWGMGGQKTVGNEA